MKPKREEYKYFTCSQSWMPTTVAQAIGRISSGLYPTVKSYATLAEALQNVEEKGTHNIVLEADKKGMLQIHLALWDPN